MRVHIAALGASLQAIDGDDGPGLLDIPLKLESTIEVVAAENRNNLASPDARLRVRTKRDGSQLERLQKAIPQPLLLTRYDQGGGKTALECVIEIENSPCDVAFDVIMRNGIEQWNAGRVIARQGQSVSTSVGGTIPDDCPWLVDRPFVDVILRSSVEAALTSPGMDEIWEGRVAFPETPVLDRGEKP
jgi:hypothetical protein